MSLKTASGSSFREYTIRHVGQVWVTSALKAVFFILPLLVGSVVFAQLYWPFAATGAVAIILTLYSMRGPYEHDRVLRVDKSEGTLTVVEKRSGEREKLTHQVSLAGILSVGTCCRSHTVYKRGGESSFTAYSYAPVFLLKNGHLIETLASPEKKSPGTDLQAANQETMTLARFLGVSGVTVGERQTVRVFPAQGTDSFELRAGRLPLASTFQLSSVQIPLLIVFVILVFYLFASLEQMRKELVGDTKEARIQKMISNAPRPKPPVDNSNEGILRRGNYSEVRKLVESGDLPVNDVLKDGLTPLQVVCAEDLNPETAWVLIRSGASQTVVNEQGQVPGDYLVQKFLSGSEIGLNQCLTLAVLIEHGYQVPFSKDRFGMTPLHHFVRDPRMDSAVEAMVEFQGVDINLPDEYGWSVLHHAVEAREGDLKLALIRLLKLGADTGARSKKTSGPALQRNSDKAVADFELPAKSTALDLLEHTTTGSQVSGRKLLE